MTGSYLARAVTAESGVVPIFGDYRLAGRAFWERLAGYRYR